MSSSVSSVALPSLLWRRREANSVNSNDSEPVELAHTPTWPAHLPLQAKAFPGQPQPNLYLQLAQILEWEIWTHNQTRGQLTNEKGRCAELEARICQISDELSHWQKTCQDAYKALDEHRQEHGRLCQELHTAAAERGNVQAQNRKTPEPWHLQRPAGENRIDILLKHEQENQGSQTPRAVDGTRLKIWDDSDLHFNKTM